MTEKLLTGLRNADIGTVAEALAEDVTLHVAVHDQPFEGKPTTESILSTLVDGVFSNIEITETFVSGTRTAASFDVDIINHPQRAQGLLTIRLNATDKVEEIIVFLRPLAALQELSAEMERRLKDPPAQGAQ